MTPLWGHTDAVSGFVARMIDAKNGFGPCEAMGVIDRAGKLVAGVVYHNYHRETGVIEASAASVNARWATRGVLGAALSYAFGQLGVQTVVARTDIENVRTRRLWRAMGATEHELPNLRGRGRSEIVLILTDDAWRASHLRRP